MTGILPHIHLHKQSMSSVTVQNTRISKCDRESDMLAFKSDYMMHNSIVYYIITLKI